MSFLTNQLANNTVLWLFLSAVVGGVVGASSKFLFEDVIRPRLGWSRESKRLARKYTVPLIRAAESLERQLNTLVRNSGKGWYEAEHDYYRLSLLYGYGSLLGWIHVLDRRFDFVPFEGSRSGAQLDRRVQAFYKAMTSFAYFRGPGMDASAVQRSLVPRKMLTAIGEVMVEPAKDGQAEPSVMSFSTFCITFNEDAQFSRWFRELSDTLCRADNRSAHERDRIIAAAAALRVLVPCD